MQQVLDTTTLGKPSDALTFDAKRVDGSAIKCIAFWSDALVWHLYIVTYPGTAKRYIAHQRRCIAVKHEYSNLLHEAKFNV